jgi:hypothetical protein
MQPDRSSLAATEGKQLVAGGQMHCLVAPEASRLGDAPDVRNVAQVPGRVASLQ